MRKLRDDLRCVEVFKVRAEPTPWSLSKVFSRYSQKSSYREKTYCTNMIAIVHLVRLVFGVCDQAAISVLEAGL